MREKVNVIKFDNVSKSFGNNVILKEQSFSLPSGKIIGIVGPSGAGKSTLLNMIVGLEDIDDGIIEYTHTIIDKSNSTYENEKKIKEIIGYATQESSFYPQLSVNENLLYFGSLLEVNKNGIKEKIDLLLKEFNLESAKALELQKLEKDIIPQTKTALGKVRLRSSLLAPSTNVNLIRSKQGAILELEENKELRENLERIINTVGSREEEASRYWRGNCFSNESAKNSLINFREVISECIDSMGSLKPESQYLNQLIGNISSINDSTEYLLATENICRQGANILPQSQTKFFSKFPIVRNTFSDFRIGPALAIGSFFGSLGVSLGHIGSNSEVAAIYFGVLGYGISGFAAGNIFSSLEKGLTLKPTFKKFETSEKMQSMLQSIGSLDEILTLTELGMNLEDGKISRCMPEIVESEKHSLRSTDLTNLISAQERTYIPARELDLTSNIHFLTGPNSSGKTTNAKASVHLQLLAQMGSYVPASSASVVPTDRIFYHVGENDSQMQSEGGYGSQLEKSKAILSLADSQSYVIIDDLIEGTDPKQTTKQTMNQFYGLTHTGANVLVISHKYDLVQEFSSRTGLGNYLQLEFDGDEPTRQIIPGISTDSKGDLVARRVGMDNKGIESLLKQRGKLNENESLYSLGIN